MRVGLLRDYTLDERPGGAQRAVELFGDACPETVELVHCPPGGIDQGCDLYITTMVKRYTEDELKFVMESGKPHVRYEMDWWDDAPNMVLSKAFTEHANVVMFSSPLHLQWFLAYRGLGGNTTGKYISLAPPINPAEYKDARAKYDEQGRNGLCYFGDIHPSKGIDMSLRWSKTPLQEANKGVDPEDAIYFDLYGPLNYTINVHQYARYQGLLPLADLWDAVASHEWLIHMPRKTEPFSRNIIEALHLGLKVHTNGRLGVESWMEHCQQGGMDELAEKCELSAGTFWEIVEQVA